MRRLPFEVRTGMKKLPRGVLILGPEMKIDTISSEEDEVEGIGVIMKLDDVWHEVDWLCDSDGYRKGLEDIRLPELEKFVQKTRETANRNGCRFIEPDMKELLEEMKAARKHGKS